MGLQNNVYAVFPARMGVGGMRRAKRPVHQQLQAQLLPDL